MLFGPSQPVITSGHDSNFCISFFVCWVEAAMTVSFTDLHRTWESWIQHAIDGYAYSLVLLKPHDPSGTG